MCSVWMIYLLVPVFVGLLISEYKHDIFRVIKIHLFEDTLHDDTIDSGTGWTTLVFIPSARQNKEQRQAVRETWGADILEYNNNKSNRNRFVLKFLIGSKGCPIHPADLTDEYSCKQGNLSIPKNKEGMGGDGEFLAVESLPVPASSTNQNGRYYGLKSLSFIVHHPIILTKLGVYMDSMGDQLDNTITVKLLESTTQREIVSSIFTRNRSGKMVDIYHYRPVEQFLLPRGFHGTLVYDSISDVDLRRWNGSVVTGISSAASSIIQYISEKSHLPDGHYEDVARWRADPIHLVSFMFKLHEIEKLREHVANQESRNKEVGQRNTLLTNQLLEESRLHGDIILLDMIDVYRNLPEKILRFSRWAVEESGISFQYALKADDDSYVMIDRVAGLVDEIQGGGASDRVWAGRFRHNWFVERTGKWAEPDYSSNVYPRFACGSAYLLSHYISTWISNNSQHLKTYQGEDVSMGIWLSAINTTIIDEPLWRCDKDCLSDMYAMSELHPEEMKRHHRYKIQCGDVCGCD